MARKALFIVLILSLMAVPALAKTKSSGQAGATATATAPAGQNNRIFADFGTRWNSMSDKERDAFMEGYISALRLLCTNSVMTAAKQTNKTPDQQEIAKQFNTCMTANFPFPPSSVKEAMSALYQESANNHIPFDVMIGFAFEKAGNKPYEDDLAKLRQDIETRLKSDK